MSLRCEPIKVIAQGATIRITYEAMDGTDSTALDINPTNIRTIIPLNTYSKAKSDTTLKRISVGNGVLGSVTGDTLKVWMDTGVNSIGMPRTTANKTVARIDSTDVSILSLIPAAQVKSDWNSVSGLSQILNKPTIPSAQIQSDWSQASTVSPDYIKNKPSIGAGSVTSVTAGTGLSGGIITTSGIISLPNVGTASTYGSATQVPVLTTDAQGRVSLVTTANPKLSTPYSITTNSSGIATITYPVTYTVIPNVNGTMGLGASNKMTILLTTSTTTGCSFLIQLRADVLGLLPTYSNVNGQVVDVQVLEK